jgi:hypothetical protein
MDPSPTTRRFRFGPAFFGWLVATGLSALLLAVTVAVASLAGVPVTGTGLTSIAETNGAAAAVILLSIMGVSYFAGGYVAGRLARLRCVAAAFGVWAIAGVLTLLVAALGGLIGAELGGFSQFELPSLSNNGGEVALGGLGAMLVSSALTLVTSLLGGKLGERYHALLDEQLAVDPVA